MNKLFQLKKKLFVLLILFFFPLYLYSQTLTFITSQIPPYVYTENNKIKGFNVEILNKIFTKMGIEVNYKIVPWARAIMMVKSGQADAIFPFFKTKERELFADYTDSFTSEPIAMFVLRDSNISYDGTLESLSSYRFGRVRAYSSGVQFDKAVKDGIVQIEEAITSEQNLNKIFKKRFDILVDNQYNILYQLKKQNMQNEVRQLYPILSDTEAYLGFSKKKNYHTIIKKFNTILKDMKEDGSYDAIIDFYFKE